MICNWCDSHMAYQDTNTVYWELPDGTRAITILNTPCVTCPDCGMVYQEDNLTEEIEDQLLLINTRKLPDKLTYDELMKKERLLKRNYFR